MPTMAMIRKTRSPVILPPPSEGTKVRIGGFVPHGVQQHGADEPCEVEQAKHDHDALPAAIAAGGDETDERDRRERYGDGGRDPQAAHGERYRGELGHQRQEVHQQQVEQREPSPPGAKPLVDHRGVAFAGGDAEAGDHLLHEVADGEQDEEPEQMRAVLAAGLHVGGDGAGVVVGLHDNEAGTEHHEEAEHAALPGTVDRNPFVDCAGWSLRGELNSGGHVVPPSRTRTGVFGARLSAESSPRRRRMTEP